MSRAAHSPGPWAISRGFKSITITSSRRLAGLMTWQRPMQSDISDEEAEANMAAAMAAPDMLAALKKVAAIRGLTYRERALVDIFDEIDAAIAKAEGRS